MISRLFRGTQKPVPAVDQPPSEAPSDAGWGRSTRADLLQRIADFLLRHDLDVSPRTLALAHAIQSGSDLWLCEKLFEREMSGRPVTLDWLEAAAGAVDDPDAIIDTIGQMMEQLEGSMTRFEGSAQRAISSTGESRQQFQRHFAAASDPGSGAIPQRFVELTQAVLGSLQRIEGEMRRTQDETQELRDNLKQARADAYNDHLTRLPNRRAFEKRFAQYYEQALANGGTLFVAICDVDNFKGVNDRFGHETGDGLLRAIAAILQEITCNECFVARHGGEEFVLLFRNTDLEVVLERIEHARCTLRARRFIARSSKQAVGTISFSAGVADVMSAEGPRAALAEADKALYRAKECGRDRVICA